MTPATPRSHGSRATGITIVPNRTTSPAPTPGLVFPPGLTADQQLDLLLAQQAKAKRAAAQARARASSPFSAVRGAEVDPNPFTPPGQNPFTPPGDAEMVAELRGIFQASLGRLPHGEGGAHSRAGSEGSRKRQLAGAPTSPRGIPLEPVDDVERDGYERRIEELERKLALAATQAALMAQKHGELQEVLRVSEHQGSVLRLQENALRSSYRDEKELWAFRVDELEKQLALSRDQAAHLAGRSKELTTDVESQLVLCQQQLTSANAASEALSQQVKALTIERDRTAKEITAASVRYSQMEADLKSFKDAASEMRIEGHQLAHDVQREREAVVKRPVPKRTRKFVVSPTSRKYLNNGTKPQCPN